VTYVRQEGETPLAFISRVRDQHTLWREEVERKNRQAAKEASKAANSSPSSGSTNNRSRDNLNGITKNVQTVEDNLEAAIESQVTGLRRQVSRLEDEIKELEHTIKDKNFQCGRAMRELAIAERFLDELRAQKANTEMGTDLSGQVRGESDGRQELGQSDDPLQSSTGSAERDEENSEL
jgi:chromosome segregation ATPase